MRPAPGIRCGEGSPTSKETTAVPVTSLVLSAFELWEAGRTTQGGGGGGGRLGFRVCCLLSGPNEPKRGHGPYALVGMVCDPNFRILLFGWRLSGNAGLPRHDRVEIGGDGAENDGIQKQAETVQHFPDGNQAEIVDKGPETTE